MTASQKVIKYIALSLAALLIITIVSSIILALNLFSGILGLNKSDMDKNMHEVDIKSTDIKKIDIELSTTLLEFRNANEFKIEVNNDKVKILENGSTLKIEEQKTFFMNFLKDSKIIIYIPVSMDVEELSIELGASSVHAESIYTSNFDLDIGIGNVEIGALYVSSSSEITSGIGSLLINNGRVNDLNLEMGIGTCEINTILTGKNDIEGGIGAININLLTKLDNYDIRLDKGIGNVKINNKKASDNIYGNGPTKINVEAGIGSIEIITTR